MRLMRFLFCYVLLSAFGVVLALFLAQNWGTIRVSFFGLDYSVHLAWVLAGAAACGVLATLVLLLPGRLAAMMHRWSLERELRQWEQDLWRLQEQHGRLLNRHERLLEAHERVLQAHHRLVGEHGQVAAERDQIRAQLAQLAAARTSADYQQARVPSLPRVAVTSSVSAGAPVSSGGRTGIPVIIPVPSRPRAHELRGGKVSTSAPRWAVPCPPARSAPAQDSAAAVRTSGASLQSVAADQVAHEAGEAVPALPPVPAVPQPVTTAQSLEQHVQQLSEPAPAVVPLPAAAEPSPLRAAPRTVPILPTEAVAGTSTLAAASAAPAGLEAPVVSLLIALRSVRRAAESAIASVSPRLAMLRNWLRAKLAALATAAAAKRVLLEARLAHLKRSILQGGLPLDSEASRSASTELPSGDERRS